MEGTLMTTAGRLPPARTETRADCDARRSSRVAAVVAAIYLALVASTPLLVRYGPAPDDHAVEALATRIDLPRCTGASTPGLACKSWTAAASPHGHPSDI